MIRKKGVEAGEGGGVAGTAMKKLKRLIEKKKEIH